MLWGWGSANGWLCYATYHAHLEPVPEKTNNCSDQVQHKPACTVTEDGTRLEILDLESRGIVLDKGSDQLCSNCKADLRLYFRLSRLLVFPCGGSI